MSGTYDSAGAEADWLAAIEQEADVRAKSELASSDGSTKSATPRTDAAKDYTAPEKLHRLSEELETENTKLRAFVERISRQKPEKPDYWCSCGQCEHNIDDAQKLLSNAELRDSGQR